jgi:hypothetical protein
VKLSRNPAERAAVERLIAAGLLEDNDGVLWPTQRTEATFQAPLIAAISADRINSARLAMTGAPPAA